MTLYKIMVNRTYYLGHNSQDAQLKQLSLGILPLIRENRRYAAFLLHEESQVVGFDHVHAVFDEGSRCYAVCSVTENRSYVTSVNVAVVAPLAHALRFRLRHGPRDGRSHEDVCSGEGRGPYCIVDSDLVADRR